MVTPVLAPRAQIVTLIRTLTLSRARAPTPPALWLDVAPLHPNGVWPQ
jgi:hypothetical protein